MALLRTTALPRFARCGVRRRTPIRWADVGAIDPELLRQTLITELSAAWQTLKLAHAGEQFYSFGFYTAELAEYLMVTASTEEGLAQVVGQYLAGQGGDPQLTRASLRWSPCDSPLHLEGELLLPESGRLRAAGPDPYDDTREAEESVALVFDTAVAALGHLDQEGTFGPDADRNRLVLGVWEGDQSDEERVEVVRKLNPAAVAKHFAHELEAGTEAFFELSRQRATK